MWNPALGWSLALHLCKICFSVGEMQFDPTEGQSIQQVDTDWIPPQAHSVKWLPASDCWQECHSWERQSQDDHDASRPHQHVHSHRGGVLMRHRTARSRAPCSTRSRARRRRGRATLCLSSRRRRTGSSTRGSSCRAGSSSTSLSVSVAGRLRYPLWVLFLEVLQASVLCPVLLALLLAVPQLGLHEMPSMPTRRCN